MQFLLQPRILRIAAIVIAVLFAAYVAYTYFTHKPPPDERTFQEEYALALTDTEGQEVRLEQFRGSVLIVYAWATWCPYCADELRNLASLKTEYGDKIRIVAVNRAEPVEEAKAFVANLGLGDEIEFLFDSADSLYKEVGGYAMPETVFVDARGDIVFHQRGPMTLEQADSQLQMMLQ